MTTGPEDFEQLRRLLKWKRHELPPPGYFNNFSTKVISRIEAAEAHGQSTWAETPWFRKLLGMLETNPVAAGFFGVSVCGLMVSGIAYSQSQAAFDVLGASNSNVSIDVADAAVSSGAPAWAKLAKTDSLVPSIDPAFSTNLSSGSFTALDQVVFRSGGQ